MRIAVIAGHGLTGPGDQDPGGCGPAGCEADWTADLAERLALALRAAGHEVGTVTLGSSLDRSLLADSIGPDLVVYAHGDIGAGGVFYYPRSGRGLTLATEIAQGLAWLAGGLPVREATATGYPRAYGLLGRTRAPAVLLELVDQRDAGAVRTLLQRLDDVAAAVVRGLR